MHPPLGTATEKPVSSRYSRNPLGGLAFWLSCGVGPDGVDVRWET